MVYPLILCKKFLKLKVMLQHFPQELLKQLDMDHRPSLTWPQRFGTLYLKRWKSYYSEWIQGQNQHLEVEKLSLPTLYNLPSADGVHYAYFLKWLMSLDWECWIVSVAILILLRYKSTFNWRGFIYLSVDKKFVIEL